MFKDIFNVQSYFQRSKLFSTFKVIFNRPLFNIQKLISDCKLFKKNVKSECTSRNFLPAMHFKIANYIHAKKYFYGKSNIEICDKGRNILEIIECYGTPV